MAVPMNSSSDALDVALVMRRALPGQFSVERVFRDVCAALPSDINGQVVCLPFESRGILPRLRNMVFTLRIRSDIVHITGDVHYCALAVRRSRCVLTVLDLVSLHRLRGLRRRILLLFWYRLPVWWAACVTTISIATKKELVTCTPIAVRKVVLVPCPVSPEFSNVNRVPWQRRTKRLLIVGTSANKNLHRLAEAVIGLPVHLRIIGFLDARKTHFLDELHLSYSFAGNLSELQLAQEYAHADILLFASTYEGFGLPILEAQAAGLPVITSNIHSMPEVAGEGALLVDPFDKASIRSAVVLLMDSPWIATSLIAKGRDNAKAYVPQIIAGQYSHIYRTLGERNIRLRSRRWGKSNRKLNHAAD